MSISSSSGGSKGFRPGRTHYERVDQDPNVDPATDKAVVHSPPAETVDKPEELGDDHD
jgi:hypothetical protein